jgi:ABC-type nickel/cobalt efflux system permease component RcnA
VFGLDEQIAQLDDGGVVMSMVLALLLGLRHATDPDHLTAVSTLVLADGREGTGRAARLGLAWGLGHAATLTCLGVPLVLLGGHLPDAIERGAEMVVGVLIVVFAVRLLVRWRRGQLHTHPHRHGPTWHSHPHVHGHAHAAGQAPEHHHDHAEALGRSPRAAFGIGLVHGIGGSGVFAALVVGSTGSPVAGAVSLLIFASATATAMGSVSAAFGYGMKRASTLRTPAKIAPVFGTLGILFGVCYLLAAI